jgi:hypothetical protein
VIITENYTQNDGRISYELTGLSVEIVQLVCEKMNLTTVFLAPSLNTEIDSYIKEVSELVAGSSDVLTGLVPLLPLVVKSSFDATITYTHLKVKMLLPCPKALPGSQKLMTTLSLSVWLTIGLVLLLTTTVFWCAGSVPTGKCKMRQKHMSHCPTVSRMLGLCFWECQFHSSPQLPPSEFSSFSTSVLFRY